jgi:hypothetical protein
MPGPGYASARRVKYRWSSTLLQLTSKVHQRQLLAIEKSITEYAGITPLTAEAVRFALVASV